MLVEAFSFLPHFESSKSIFDLAIIVVVLQSKKHESYQHKKDTHREAGTQVLEIFTEWKSLYIGYSGKLQKAWIDEVEI
jgi:hypothetical protein